MRKLHIGCGIVQYMHNICTRFSHNAQYMRKIVLLSPMCNIYAIYVLYLRKIVLISPMRNICERFAQDCTCFLNAQYMRKIVHISLMRNICARLYFFLQYARFVQDCTSFSNAQYLCKKLACIHLFSRVLVDFFLGVVQVSCAKICFKCCWLSCFVSVNV